MDFRCLFWDSLGTTGPMSPPLLAKKVRGESITCSITAREATTCTVTQSTFIDVFALFRGVRGPHAARPFTHYGDGPSIRTGKDFVLPITANQPARARVNFEVFCRRCGAKRSRVDTGLRGAGYSSQMAHFPRNFVTEDGGCCQPKNVRNFDQGK